MIRWRSLLIRLSVVIAVVVAARYALGPLAKHTASRMIWAGTDARVQIGKSTVGLFPPVVRFDDVTVTSLDEQAHSSPIASLKSIEMEVDAEALLHRRYVIRSGRIDGLELTANQLSLDPGTADSANTQATSDQCFGEFVSELSTLSQVTLDGTTQSLELTKRADQIRRRWKSEYTMLRQQAETLQASLEKASTSTQGLNNPLRDRERVESALAKSKQVQTELAAVRRAIDELPNQIQQDILSLQQAKQVDQTQLANGFAQRTRANEPEPARLVAANINAQVDRLHEYLNWCRTLASQPLVQAPATDRGQVIDLDHGQHSPNWFVQRCDVSGKLVCNQQPIGLTGLIENLTSELGSSTAPFRARLKLQGAQSVRIDYSRNESNKRLTRPTDAALARDRCVTVAAGQHRIDGRCGPRRKDRSVGSTGVCRRSDFRTSDLAEVWRRTRGKLDSCSRRNLDSPIATDTRCGQPCRCRRDVYWHLERYVLRNRDQLNAFVEVRDGSIDDRSSRCGTSSIGHQLDELYQREMQGLQASLTAEQTQTRELVAKADEKAQALSDSLLGDSDTAEAYLGRLRAGSLR